MMQLMLLEPYRRALFAMGIEEGLVPIPKNLDLKQIAESPTPAIGNNKSLQQNLCQLLILYDQVSIIHYETLEFAEALEERGAPGLSAIWMKDQGLVTFAQPPQGGEDRLRALRAAEQTLEGIWSVEQPLLELWEPAILAQMQAKGKLPHPSVYYLLKDLRLGRNIAAQEALNRVPREARAFARAIRQDNGRMWDMVIFSTLNELLGVEEIVSSADWAVATEAMHRSDPSSSHAQSKALDVFEIVIKELIVRDFKFPICHRLTEVEKLRRHPDIAEFRKAFFPWLASFRTGDSDSEKRLRREVQSAARAFEHHKKVQSMGWLVVVVAIAAGFIEPFTATGLTFVGIGLPKLAELWKNKSRWLGLCARKEYTHN